MLQMEFISREHLLPILKALGSIFTSSKKSYKSQKEKQRKDKCKEGMGRKKSRERGNKVKKMLVDALCPCIIYFLDTR